MKAFAAFVLSAIVLSQARPVAIDLIGGWCCDDQSVARCKVFPFQPVGTPCWCPGTGLWRGQVCL